MRILKTTQAYYPYLESGGAAIKVKALAERLVRHGNQVTVLTAHYGHPGKTETRWVEGVEVIYLGYLSRRRALTINHGAVSFSMRRLQEFDLVHIYGLYDLLGPIVAFFCRRQGIAYVVEPMGMFRPIVRSLRLKRLYHRLLGRSLLAGARCLIATSEQERKEFIDGGIPATKTVVRRNGIEPPERMPAPGTFRQQWGIEPHSKIVLFLGRLVSKKSPDLLLETFANLRQASQGRQDYILVLAGPDEGDGYLEQLRSLTKRLGLNGYVRFTGPLYDDAKWAAYRDADVFVLPSQHENFGNAAAEAIACGTPVIVTDRCGIAPLVDQQAGLVVPYERAALETSLSRLLQDDTLVQRLRAGCGPVAQALSWDEPLAVLETLYRKLLAEAQPQ